MSRISLAALAAGTLTLAAMAFPAAAQAPAAEHDDYSKAENWLCWPGRTDACSGDKTSTVITADGKATDWGLHLIDVNVAMGNLVDLAESQGMAWRAKQ